MDLSEWAKPHVITKGVADCSQSTICSKGPTFSITNHSRSSSNSNCNYGNISIIAKD